MNEANCNVIQDILPLYLDNAVSEDTAKMVEEHLHTCKECMEYKKKMEADIVVTENNEGKKLLRKINDRIRKKIVVSVVAAIAALAALIVGGIYVYKWMQVNKMTRLSINEISFNYMASPYITDDLEYIKRNMPNEILQDIFTGDSDDYLYMTYDMSYDNRSFSSIKVHKKLISQSGKYTDNIVWQDEVMEDEIGKGKLSVADARFIIYVGNLDNEEKEELIDDLAVKVSFANSLYESDEIIIDTKKCRADYLIRTTEDYRHVENYYGDYYGWKDSNSEIYKGLGYFTAGDIVNNIITGSFAVDSFNMDKYVITEKDGIYKYLFDIGDVDGYGILIETPYNLMTKEHINDNVAENTYIVKKDTGERVMCIAGATLEQLEKITGKEYTIYGYNN